MLTTSRIIRRIYSKTARYVSSLPVNFDNVNNILKSPYPDIQVPNDVNFTQFLFQNVEKWQSMPAVTDGFSDKSYTFNDVLNISEKISLSFIHTLGIKPGDVILLIMPNCPEYMFVLLGAISVGIVVSTANPSYTTGEILKQLIDCDARTIITTPELLKKVQNAADKFPRRINHIILATNGNMDQESKLKSELDHPNHMSLHELIKKSTYLSRYKDELPKADPDSLALLPYSSGTTGMPKGVQLLHKHLVANLCQSDRPEILPVVHRNGGQHVSIAVLPWYHIYGLVLVMSYNLLAGYHSVTVPKFEPYIFCSAIHQYKPSLLNVVPPILLFLATTERLTKDAYENLQWIMTGAAPATNTLIEKFMMKVHPNDIEFKEGYGMTEASPLVLMTPKARDGLNIIGSAGVPVPNTEIKFVNEDGVAVEQGKEGELWVRGPQVMAGYHKNEKATHETITEDGWLKTGDVGYVNNDGLVFIVDRIKELIKVKGLQVSPTELEAIIRQMDGISDVAVIGKPDERSGELPMAFVVKNIGSDMNENDVISYVEPRVAPFKQLAGGVQFVDDIPKSAAGKILRRVLKEDFIH